MGPDSECAELNAYNARHEQPEGNVNPVFDENLNDEKAKDANYIPEVKVYVIEDPVKDGEAAEEENEDAKEEKDDPWALTELKDPGIPWSELDGCGKAKRVLWEYVGKCVVLLGLLYLFICSLDFLGTAFKLLGGKAAGQVFSESELLKNPVTGLVIGVLATVLLQSSSTTTSIVVTMVAAQILTVQISIPIVMGANIGTSVTNTIVAVGQMADRNEFRKAFAAATVHDMFNWMCVLIFLPLEAGTHFIYLLTLEIIKSLNLTTNEAADIELLKVITKPFTSLVIQIDKSLISAVAKGEEGAIDRSMLKIWCKYNTTTYNDTIQQVVNTTSLAASVSNATTGISLNTTKLINVTVERTRKIPIRKCEFIFMNVAESWGDAVIGTILLVIALVILCVCLVLIVKLLHSLLKGRIAAVLKKIVNANFPGYLSWLTGYVAILVGAGMTMLVQSSSIFTSAITPLVGAGVLHIKRMYPLTLGANIGTTFTSILAALASDGETLGFSLQIALCHLFFNIFGIALWYPIPALRHIPIRLAKILGNTTAKYRWFALFYIVIMFFIMPAFVFGLSVGGVWVLAGVGIPLLVISAIIIIINVIQRKRPGCLPRKLRNWDFLPLWMHSLDPLDRVLSKVVCCKRCNTEKPVDKDDGDAMKEDGLYNTTDL